MRTEEQVRQAAAVGRHGLSAGLIGVCEAALAVLGLDEPRATVEVTAARGMLLAALTDRSGWAASLAKARAGRAQAAVMRMVLAASGPAGSTKDSEVPRCVGRAAALDLLLGGHAELDARVGRTPDPRRGAVVPVVQI